MKACCRRTGSTRNWWNYRRFDVPHLGISRKGDKGLRKERHVNGPNQEALHTLRPPSRTLRKTLSTTIKKARTKAGIFKQIVILIFDLN
jgi:hypothetical protein